MKDIYGRATHTAQLMASEKDYLMKNKIKRVRRDNDKYKVSHPIIRLVLSEKISIEVYKKCSIDLIELISDFLSSES